MKHFLLFTITILISVNVQGQKSFEGLIKFSTHISTSKLAPENAEEMLRAKYGDSLIMYYSANGDFKRVHKNNSEFAADTQLYQAEKGILYFLNKNKVVDSLDVTMNSLKIINNKKVSNETITGLDCNCYQYEAVSIHNQNVILKYCFSKKTPKVNADLYTKHKDFFLDELYEVSKRPYLKYSIQTDEFTITYVAAELIIQRLNQDFFEIE